jgi:hypothetical protein
MRSNVETSRTTTNHTIFCMGIEKLVKDIIPDEHFIYYKFICGDLNIFRVLYENIELI